MKTKAQIIDETAEYYSTPGRRSVRINEGGARQCLYMGPDGKRCAFARVIANPQDMTEFDAASAVMSHCSPIFLDGYSGHSGFFWNDIQQLHDLKEHWSEDGPLTATGEAFVAELHTWWDEKFPESQAFTLWA